MKIRTDFVTNSSSSSYCLLTIKMKDKSKFELSGDDGAGNFVQVPDDAEELLKSVASVNDLIEFVKHCMNFDYKGFMDRAVAF